MTTFCDDDTPDPYDANWNPALMTHEQWKRGRTLLLQRQRRERHPRIDYYPNKDALKIVRAFQRTTWPGDASSVIDQIILGTVREAG